MKNIEREKLELMRRQTAALEKLASLSQVAHSGVRREVQEGNFTRIYDGYGNNTLVDEWGTPRRYQD